MPLSVYLNNLATTTLMAAVKFSVSRILDQLSNLYTTKLAGPDDIPSSVVKYLASSGAFALRYCSKNHYANLLCVRWEGFSSHASAYAWS